MNVDKSSAASGEQPCSKALQVVPRKATLTGLWVNLGVGCKGVLDLALIVDTPHGLNHTIAQCSHLPGIALISDVSHENGHEHPLLHACFMKIAPQDTTCQQQ